MITSRTGRSTSRVCIKGLTRYGVVGMNSIAIYVAYQLTAGWIRSVGKGWFNIGSFGAEWSAFFSSLWVLAVLWTFCWWLWKRKLFIKI